MREFVIGAALALALLGPGDAMAMSEAGGTGAPSAVLYAVTYRAGPAWQPGRPMEAQGLRDHFFYMRSLHQQGLIAAAGPMGAEGGLMLIYVADRAAAEAILARDPAIQARIFTADVQRFDPKFVGTTPLVSERR